MRVRALMVLAGLVLAACGGGSADESDAAFVTCPNGIVVFSGVDCAVVGLDSSELPAAIQARVDELRAEAEADPSKALANAQTMQGLLAAQPFQVCEVMQNDPDSAFLQTDNIAPVVEELAATVCPTAAVIEAN